MVVDAFLYMYVVGLGLSLGVATVVFIAFKIYQKNKVGKKKRKGIM